MSSARPRLARGDLAGAPVVVIAPARASAAERTLQPADIEIACPSGPPLPEAPAGFGLGLEDEEQRRLAAALADQERVAILLLDAGGAWVARVELELGAETRALIAAAARPR
jgi:hypothetical protein